MVFIKSNSSLNTTSTHTSTFRTGVPERTFPNVRSPEHMFDVYAAAVVWGRPPTWELRLIIGAAWELHPAAALGRPGAASNFGPGSCVYVRPGAAHGSCAGPLSNFLHGSCKFYGSCVTTAARQRPHVESCVSAQFIQVEQAAAAEIWHKMSNFLYF